MAVASIAVIALYFGSTIPVSLLPPVNIPRITVSISAPDKTARIIENTMTRPVRNQLMQMGNLTHIESASRNGSAFITIHLQHGTNTDLSFIEANEKIDQVMNLLPREMEWPRVVKSTLSDIPVFSLAVAPKDAKLADPIEVSEFAEKVIKRRLELLPEIAFVDLHGISSPEILLTPYSEKMTALGIREDILAQELQNQSIEIGNVMIRDGQYQYNIELGAGLVTRYDLEQMHIGLDGQIYRLRDLAEITYKAREPRSSYIWEDENAVILSVRKRDHANHFVLNEKMEVLLEDFKDSYSLLDFHIHNNQSTLLEVSYQNLRTSLMFGILFSSLVLFLFFREWRLPVLIIITVPLGLLVSLLGFFLAGISINIISLAGLILGIGLMIDNAIIIIDNIRQHASFGLKDEEHFITGTLEVVRPLISSAMTTCSVFLPLILISGVAGALFYDQALSITIALTSSLLVSYLVLPVLSRLVLKSPGALVESKDHALFRWHHRLLHFVIRYRYWALCVFAGLTASAIYLFKSLNTGAFPALTTDAIEMHIDWNENIDIRESELRIKALRRASQAWCDQFSAVIGEKQFLLTDGESGINEVDLYARLKNADDYENTRLNISTWMHEQYPKALFDISPVRNTFDHIFGQEKAPLIAFIQPVGQYEIPPPDEMKEVVGVIQKVHPSFQPPPLDTYLEIWIRSDLLTIYQVDYTTLIHKIKALFNALEVSKLRSSDRFIPVVMGLNAGTDLQGLLEGQYVRNKSGEWIPVRNLVEIRKNAYYKEIRSTITGEAFIVPFDKYDPTIETQLKQDLSAGGRFNVFFEGQYYENLELIRQLTTIFFIVILLLFLILAAQFESFRQPLIVLLIVPVSVAGALASLYWSFQTLNTVSMVGIIVMTGIIVNDAILKIDMINKNLEKNMEMIPSILNASKRRMQPIIMTSLTTILAFTPVLFTKGLGAEIQTPLAIAIIGGLTVGTFSSLIFIPVLYLFFSGKRDMDAPIESNREI